MIKKVIACGFIVVGMVSCNSPKAYLYVHRTEKNDGDIFGYPKNGFFGANAKSDEITKYQLALSKKEVLEVEKLLNAVKLTPDLDTLELTEAPHDIALIVERDTFYAWGNHNVNSWAWKNKVVVFNSKSLKDKIGQYY